MKKTISLSISLFFSGLSATSFEFLWIRIITSLIGGNFKIFAIVIGVFLLGISLGTIFSGRILRFLNKPLLAFFIVELIIAFWGSSSYEIALALEEDSRNELFFSLSLIFFPSFLMGWTLPLSVSIICNPKDVGIIYGADTLGAFLGPIISLILLYKFGFNSQRIIALFNILSALSIIPIIKEKKTNGNGREIMDSKMDSKKEKYIISIFISFVSGFTTISSEIFYLRIFDITFGSTIYQQSFILSAFILNISLGSFFFSLKKNKNEVLYLYLISSAISFIFLFKLPHIALSFNLPFLPFLAMNFLLCVFISLPAFFAGYILPYSVNLAGLKNFHIVYFFNAMGNFFASITFPYIVKKMGLYSFIPITFLIFLILISLSSLTTRRTIFILLGVLVSVSSKFFLDEKDFSSSTVRFFSVRDFFEQKKIKNILFECDDEYSHVVVFEVRGIKTLTINGKPDASEGGDMKTQIISGIIPLAFHPDPKNALVIGLGSGHTANTLSLFTPVKVVEISPCVVKAEKFFEKKSNGKYDIVVDDARRFVKKTQERFDIIVSEPSNPYVRGASLVFTKEFMEDVKKILNGVFVQWFHSYEMNEEIFKTFIKTFLDVFKNFEINVFYSQYGDMLFVASKEKMNLENLINRLENLIKKEKIFEEISFLTPNLLPILKLYEKEDLFFKVYNFSKIHSIQSPVFDFLSPKALRERTQVFVLQERKFEKYVEFLKSLDKEEIFKISKYFYDKYLQDIAFYCFILRESVGKGGGEEFLTRCNPQLKILLERLGLNREKLEEFLKKNKDIL